MLSCLEGTHADCAVRRHGGGAEVVRHAAALVLEVRLVAVTQDDGLLRRHRGRVHDHDLAAGRHAAGGCLHDGRALTRLRRRDESRDVHQAAVAVDGHVPRVRADVDDARLRVAGDIELRQLAGGLQRHVCKSAGRRHRDAERLRRERQAIVRVTASVAGLMTLMVALCLFVTQTSPLGAMARVRGAVPTAISASFALVTRRRR